MTKFRDYSQFTRINFSPISMQWRQSKCSKPAANKLSETWVCGQVARSSAHPFFLIIKQTFQLSLIFPTPENSLIIPGIPGRYAPSKKMDHSSERSNYWTEVPSTNTHSSKSHRETITIDLAVPNPSPGPKLSNFIESDSTTAILVSKKLQLLNRMRKCIT